MSRLKKDILSLLTGGISVCLLLGGCSGVTEEADSGKPKVVATSTILRNWTEEVAGDEVQIQGILEPGEDPHIYEPVPLDNQIIEDADLILYNGYNLEPALIKLIQSSVSGATFAVGEVIEPLDYDYQGQREPDPHVWGDAENAIAMVNTIRDQLIELSPEDKAEFTANAEALTQTLQEVDGWIAEQVATIPENQRQLVTTHDAFQYYTKAYGLEVAGTLIGMSTEEQPSAQTVKRLSDDIRRAKVPAIFAETTINPALITTVAQEAKVKLSERQLYSDSLGAPGSEAETYVKMLVANTQTIVEALGGSYQDFPGS
ncbi:Manganese ABC transporter substrate-binding lipoprotein [Acaryochloris thomasi RCC1774]|uniref:Manganese ABC transporter substrate-binding lipoprotein n=1 Tax=Acaryochloris thomasi RCC1774 TaxID=1764569 RepID=A0A2W1JPF4_9CYAN|nr:zinc ABC transporter substrate-binding protein [Acaryochloris thomasi]PZD75179.1 Manganese ABC transporter substrate-binding lipoprotein [Acaryochloris thomasi RCC1774]